LIAVDPDLTIDELREALAEQSGVRMSWSMMQRWGKQMG